MDKIILAGVILALIGFLSLIILFTFFSKALPVYDLAVACLIFIVMVIVGVDLMRIGIGMRRNVKVVIVKDEKEKT